MKKIVLGSLNPVKLAALNDVLPMFPFLETPEILSYAARSGVNEQPLTLFETMSGAKNRALASFAQAKGEIGVLGVGIESGLMDMPIGVCGKTDLCICALYDGHYFFYGSSQLFTIPRSVETLVVNKSMDLDKAFHTLQLTDNQKVGHAEGMVSILSGGRITRQAYTAQALISALIQLENPKLYL